MDTKQTVVNETSAKIAAINDKFRKSNPAHYTMTYGIMAKMDVGSVVRAVQQFSSFTEDNDPYGEHDFGSLKVAGEKIFWKIDYYDENLSKWCDPLSPDCHRVLTIMRADEY